MNGLVDRLDVGRQPVKLRDVARGQVIVRADLHNLPRAGQRFRLGLGFGFAVLGGGQSRNRAGYRDRKNQNGGSGKWMATPLPLAGSWVLEGASHVSLYIM